jgi:hypothetical protein
VDEEKMRRTLRIFRMVGAEGYSMHAVHKAFERERIPTPGGGKRWDRTFFRIAILERVQAAHVRGSRGAGLCGRGGASGPRAVLRHLVVQTAAGTNVPGVGALGERPPLPQGGAFHDEAQGRMDRLPGSLRGHTPRAGRRGAGGRREQPPAVERRESLLGTLRGHPPVRHLRHGDGETAPPPARTSAATERRMPRAGSGNSCRGSSRTRSACAGASTR